jgi:hypothetical protein
MNKKKILISSSLSIIAIIFSATALCLYKPRINLDFDYLGAIVGILSLLITVLIGWNIYQLIDIKDLKKELDNKSKKISKLKKSSEIQNYEVCYSMNAQLVYIFLEQIKNNISSYSTTYKIVYFGLKSLSFAYQAKRFSEFDYMKEILKQQIPKKGQQQFLIKKEDKDECLKILHSIKMNNETEWRQIYLYVSQLITIGNNRESSIDLIGIWENTNSMNRASILEIQENGCYVSKSLDNSMKIEGHWGMDSDDIILVDNEGGIVNYSIKKSDGKITMNGNLTTYYIKKSS